MLPDLHSEIPSGFAWVDGWAKTQEGFAGRVMRPVARGAVEQVLTPVRCLRNVRAFEPGLAGSARYDTANLPFTCTVRYSRGDIDLTKQKFRAPFELLDALEARHAYLVLRDDVGPRVDAAIQRLGIDISRGRAHTRMALSEAHLKDTALMRALGQALELPPDLLVLRAREVVARDELHRVERELRAMEGEGLK